MMDWNKEKVMNMADNRIITYSGRTLCDNYRNPLERCETAEQAIRLYKNCISWALQERYPSAEELLTFADNQTLAKNGVYIGWTFDGERIDDHICCVFIGCTGRITTGLNLNKKIIPMLYLSEGSRLEIVPDSTLSDGAIPIELYYGSQFYTSRKDKFRVTDNNHLTAKDNVGFSPEDAAVEPDMDNVDL